MSYLGKKVTDKWHNFRNESLDPHKDFSVKDQNKNYDLNLGAFVEAYQEFIKFMKKHKEVPDGNKKEWALQIREKVGQSMFNGYIGLFTQPVKVLERFKKFEKLKNKDFHFTEGKQINERSNPSDKKELMRALKNSKVSHAYSYDNDQIAMEMTNDETYIIGNIRRYEDD